ncbi:hypothetical protein BGX26_006883, partial [Mortierella sp. AD094]
EGVTTSACASQSITGTDLLKPCWSWPPNEACNKHGDIAGITVGRIVRSISESTVSSSSTPNMKPIKPSIVKNALHLLEQRKSIRQVAAE